MVLFSMNESGERAPFFGMEGDGSLANDAVEQIDEVVCSRAQRLLAKVDQIFMLAHFVSPLFISCQGLYFLNWQFPYQ